MLKLLDTVLLVIGLSFLAIGSVVSLIRTWGDGRHHGQLGVLPESWRRWMLDEKPADHPSRKSR